MKKQHSRGNKAFNPETLALGYGYEPKRSEGAAKPPVFLTSTFQFENAASGKHFFEVAYGLCDKKPGEELGLIYSRINNPNLQIFEERLAAWDRMERGAAFASGMAAISTTMLTLLRPGDHVLSSAPVYGGTHFLFEHILPSFGVTVHQVASLVDTAGEMRKVASEVGADKVKLIFIETPANPSLSMVDLESIVRLADELSQGRDDRVVTAVDNTLLGPVFQRPSTFGIDLVLYSATKFIAGHSDLVAGAVTGRAELVDRILPMRTILGTMATPFNAWLLTRSLETVSIRMRRQAKSAGRIARFLLDHPKVKRVHYPGTLQPGDPQHAIYERQCTGAGSLISFEIDGGEKEAFEVLDRFEVMRLAVSLGGTESLVEHPQTMTHADVPPEDLARYGVKDNLIRISVGIEHISDLLRDLEHALEVL